MAAKGQEVLRYSMAIGMMMLATIAHAEGPLIIKMDPDAPAAPPKKFIPLDKARGESQQGVLITQEKKPIPLRSDKKAIESGSLRIDRRFSRPLGPQHSLLITPQEPGSQLKPDVSPPATKTATATLEANPGALERDSEEIEGSDGWANPVLSLFGTNDATPSSFRDAMSGRSMGPISGVGRQVAWPVALDTKQYVSSGYGMRADPFTGRASFHGGIDIAAPAGTPVLATSDGTVTQVEQDRNYGKYITLQHSNGMLSRYGHLSMQSVAPGQRVRAGQTIGAVGATGRATGAHLDYRVSKEGMKFDPLTVLSVPSSVAMHIGSPVPLAVARHDGPQITPGRVVVPAASHPLPRAPMVIQVR